MFVDMKWMCGGKKPQQIKELQKLRQLMIPQRKQA